MQLNIRSAQIRWNWYKICGKYNHLYWYIVVNITIFKMNMIYIVKYVYNLPSFTELALE
jgi:hypothetical protein